MKSGIGKNLKIDLYIYLQGIFESSSSGTKKRNPTNEQKMIIDDAVYGLLLESERIDIDECIEEKMKKETTNSRPGNDVQVLIV